MSLQAVNTVFYILILIMSVVIHEVSHGFVAELFGDKTARHAGRLTLNPLKHLDWFGFLVLPILLYFSSGFVFGWAKPVPYNPYGLRNRRWGELAVASAGVFINFFIAILFGLILRFTHNIALPEGLFFILSTITLINLALAIFNLVPIPPLDGSKIFFSFLPRSFAFFERALTQYALILFFIFLIFFSDRLYPVLTFFYKLITGLALNG